MVERGDNQMRYNIITIEREYASGGRDIGKQVAENLGIPYYNEDILKLAAKEYDRTPEYLMHLEETVTGSLLHSLVMLGRASSWRNTSTKGTEELSASENLNVMEGTVIKRLASNGNCVIIGHCAGCVLAERNDVLNIFIHSDIESKRKRAVEIYGIDKNKVDSVIARFDRRRSNYYHANTSKKWDDPTGYHIVLDSGKLGISECADIITEIAKK